MGAPTTIRKTPVNGENKYRRRADTPTPFSNLNPANKKIIPSTFFHRTSDPSPKSPLQKHPGKPQYHFTAIQIQDEFEYHKHLVGLYRVHFKEDHKNESEIDEFRNETDNFKNKKLSRPLFQSTEESKISDIFPLGSPIIKGYCITTDYCFNIVEEENGIFVKVFKLNSPFKPIHYKREPRVMGEEGSAFKRVQNQTSEEESQKEQPELKSESKCCPESEKENRTPETLKLNYFHFSLEKPQLSKKDKHKSNELFSNSKFEPCEAKKIRSQFYERCRKNAEENSRSKSLFKLPSLKGFRRQVT